MTREATWYIILLIILKPNKGERTGLVVRASASGLGDLGSILGRVGVLFPWARDIYSPKSTGNTQE